MGRDRAGGRDVGGVSRPRVALVGAGHLAEAFVRGWLGAGLDGAAIAVTNRERDDRLRHMRTLGVRAERDKARVLGDAQIVVLAVRPADATGALDECRPHWPGAAPLLSLVAGTPIVRLRAPLGNDVEIVRAMPNTASAVGESATAACAPGVRETTRELAEGLLGVVGRVVWLAREEEMDAVTALSGSGPAYVYLLVEAMVEAAVAEGLDEETARILAVQTVFGAAHHLRATGGDAAALRRRVTSPGGTTAAALSVLEQRGFRPAMAEAVASAARRSRQLGRS